MNRKAYSHTTCDMVTLSTEEASMLQAVLDDYGEGESDSQELADLHDLALTLRRKLYVELGLLKDNV